MPAKGLAWALRRAGVAGGKLCRSHALQRGFLLGGQWGRAGLDARVCQAPGPIPLSRSTQGGLRPCNRTTPSPNSVSLTSSTIEQKACKPTVSRFCRATRPRLAVLLRQACAGPKNPLASRARCLRGGAAWWPARPIQSGSAGFGSREGLLVIPREPPGRMLPRFLGMALQGVEIVQGVASTEPAGVD